MPRVVLACLLSLLVTTASAQAPSPSPAAPAPAKAVAKKKSAPKAKPAGPPSVAAESGPCTIGVIPAIGDLLSVPHVGLTVFGNEFAEAPVGSWGLDDLVVARVRAVAGPGIAVRRIPFSKEAFEPYYHPPRQLFRDGRNDLTAVVQQVAASAGCQRYLVVTRSRGQIPGTNQSADGIGVLSNWSGGIFKKGSLFAFIQITVFDGGTFARHEDPLGSFGARLTSSLKLWGEDHFKRLDDFEAPTTPDAVAGNARLRDGARDLLAARLDKMLPAYLEDVRGSQ
jgi:hypothetical protein